MTCFLDVYEHVIKNSESMIHSLVMQQKSTIYLDNPRILSTVKSCIWAKILSHKNCSPIIVVYVCVLLFFF